MPPFRQSRVPRRALRTLSGVLGTLALVAGVVVTMGLMRNGHPAANQPTVESSTSATHARVPGSSAAGSPAAASSSSQPATSTATSQSQPSGSSPSPLQLAPSALPSVMAGAQVSQQITASGGTPPYSFAVTAGTLPPGLTLSPAGALSGIPTTPGSYTFTITATDSSATPDKGSAAYTLQVAPVTISFAPDALPDGIPCTSYDQTITASGGVAPYSFSVSSGSLPPGLSLSPAGVISGNPEITPKGGGQSYSFTVRATDSSATPASGSKAYTINVVKGNGTCIL